MQCINLHIYIMNESKLVMNNEMVKQREHDRMCNEELLAADADPPSWRSLGLLVCSLALDRDVDLRIDLPPGTADEVLKSWISLLWRSRSAPHIAAFRRNSAAVADHFPWLRAFLAELEEEGRG